MVPGPLFVCKSVCNFNAQKGLTSFLLRLTAIRLRFPEIVAGEQENPEAPAPQGFGIW